MKIEIITIGTEILIGQITDTNSAWIGKTLNKEGFDVSKITSIVDNYKDITESLDNSLKNSDIVIITGGLGPTKDDITKKTLCDYFKCDLVFDQSVYDNVKQFLSSEDKDINTLNRDQALVPAECQVLNNRVGTAPGMLFEKEGKVVISLPGVPSEMIYLMDTYVVPYLKKNFRAVNIIHRTVITSGIPESDLAIKIENWEKELPDYISLAYLPAPRKVKLRLTGKSDDDVTELIDRKFLELKSLVSEFIWADSDTEPEIVLGTLLKERGETISCAESCTGGNIAALLSKHSGSSAFFYGGVVSYDNSVKVSTLGVKSEDISTKGAVSREVVEQMALGVRKLMNTTWSIATSGIAGPTGGSEEKPVGTVWIAWAGPQGVTSRKYIFGKQRDKNITASTETAIVNLIKLLNQ